MGSITFQTIREAKALAYSTFAVYRTPNSKNERYSFQAYVGTQSDKLGEAIVGMNELLDDMPLAEALLDNAKKQLRQNIETQRITKEGIIFNYLSALKMGEEKDSRKEVYQQISQLTLDDLKSFHAENVAKKSYTYYVLGSRDRIKDALNLYGSPTELKLEDIFGF